MALGIGLGSIIGAGVSGALGIAGESIANQRAFSQQKELMELQQQNQMKLNKQGQKIQMENWKNTNYPAQMKMLKEAGLSAGLMYGQGGAGGTTTGSQGGGSAASGNSPKPMDIGNIIQASLIGSQVEVNKAQARKTEAEAEKIQGIDTGKTDQEIKNLIEQAATEKERQGLIRIQQAVEKAKEESLKTETKIKQVDEEINRDTKEAQKKTIFEESNKATNEAKIRKYEAELNEMGIQTTDNKVFRYLTRMANKLGWDVETLMKEIKK